MKKIHAKAWLILFIILAANAVVAQKHVFEERLQTGVVEAILPGWNFAYSTIQIKTGDESWPYLFYANNGELFLNSFKPGDNIEFKANIDLTARKSAAEVREMIMRYMRDRDRITAVRIKGEWREIHGETSPPFVWTDEWSIVLERKVLHDFIEGPSRLAIQFGDGTVAFNLLNPKYLQHAKPGTTVSCMGFAYPAKPNFVYPLRNVTRLFTYFPLEKVTGTIHSFLHMQNYAYMGLVLNTEAGELRASFPGDRAREIQAMARDGEPVTLYYSRVGSPLNAELSPIHVVIHHADTLLFKGLYYGGAGVRHEFKPVTFSGKITRIEKSDKGTMLSMIIDTEYYIELSGLLGQQLKDLITRGREVTVEGMEMVKLDGEVYKKNYRIITPKKLIIEGKEFLTNF